MTSASFSLIPITSIEIRRTERQRTELTDIESLMDSIRRIGLINPIVVTREHVLIAGERRLTACEALGWVEIPAHFTDDLTDEELQLIELEENIRREELPWQDRVRAIARYHRMKKEADPSWTQEQSGEELGFDARNIRWTLLVNRYLEEGVEGVVEAPKFSTARNFAERRWEREQVDAGRETQSSIAETVDEMLGSATPVEPTGEENDPKPSPARPPRPISIINDSFTTYFSEPIERPFNLIHCDFPYGVSAGDTKGLSSRKSYGGYDDSADIYFELLDFFCTHGDRFIAPSAHLIFWFGFQHYERTKEALESAGWSLWSRPLVWARTDNAGIIADEMRTPRHTYDVAFFGSKGDRKIVRSVSSAYCGPSTPKADRIHMSEKPVDMLKHFFRMLVDDSTRILDPTCGSGNALLAAEILGAKSGLGIELSSEYADLARRHLDLD